MGVFDWGQSILKAYVTVDTYPSIPITHNKVCKENSTHRNLNGLLIGLETIFSKVYQSIFG